MSGPTKADLTAHLETLRDASDRQRAGYEKQLADLRAERDQWKAVAPSDKEAHAIAGCIVALSTLKRSASSYSSNESHDTVAIGRVLGYLYTRFGVNG